MLPIETFVYKCGCGIHPVSLAMPNHDLVFLLSGRGKTVLDEADGSALCPLLKCKTCGRVLTLCKHDFGEYMNSREKLLLLFPDFAQTSRLLSAVERVAARAHWSLPQFMAAVYPLLFDVQQKTAEPASIEDARRDGVRVKAGLNAIPQAGGGF